MNGLAPDGTRLLCCAFHATICAEMDLQSRKDMFLDPKSVARSCLKTSSRSP